VTASGAGLFIETTARVDLVLGPSSVKRLLTDLVDKNDAWTSRYSTMELRRTAGHALKVVSHHAGQSPSDSGVYPWVLRRIEQHQGLRGEWLTEPQVRRAMQALAMVQESLGTAAATRSLVVTIAEECCDLLDRPDAIGITHETNATDCDLVNGGRRQSTALPLSCNRSKADCQQSQFLAANAGSIPALAKELGLNPEFTKVVEVLRAFMARESRASLGQKSCWALGDVILCLEATMVGAILSSNQKHFEPITLALGLRLVTYNPRT
jgi:hypothetical protein